MQLNKTKIKKLVEKNYAFTQMTFDEDYVIKDNKPDVLLIVCATGMPEVEEVRASNNSVWVTGRMNFEIMYRQEGTGNNPEVIKGAIPFQEKLMVENTNEGEVPKVNCEVEDLSVNIINSRKISIRGIINIESKVIENVQYDIAQGLESGECEQLICPEEFLELQVSKFDTLRVDNEFAIPKSKPNIGRILYDFVDVRNIETSFSGNQLNIQGELYCLVFYMSEERENEWYDTTLTFSGSIRCDEAYDPDIYWAKVNMVQKTLEAEVDYDNEMRQINLQVVFEIEICAWKNREIDILKDAYSLNENLIPQKKVLTLDRFLIKNTARNRFTEQIHMDTADDGIMQICGCKSNVRVEHSYIEDDRMKVDGMLTVHMLYIASDDGFPVRCRIDQIPFEQQIELQGVNDKSFCKLEAGVDQLQINLLDSKEYEVKAAIHVAAIAFDRKDITVIDEVESEMYGDEDDDIPGIVGYVVQKDEKLWDIAKKYRTTVEKICNVNGIEANAVKNGDKIVVVKITNS